MTPSLAGFFTPMTCTWTGWPGFYSGCLLNEPIFWRVLPDRPLLLTWSRHIPVIGSGHIPVTSVGSAGCCPHHTVSRAWCYDHYVSKLTLCDFVPYAMLYMCTNVLVLHIFIDFRMTCSRMKSRPNFTSDYDARFWARFVIGLCTVWVAGCGMARKRSARWTLWPCTRTMVSSGFTRSTCLLNCLMAELTKVH